MSSIANLHARPAYPCPLCQEPQTTCVELFPVADLVSEYARQFKVDVRRELPSGLSDVELRLCGNCGLQFFAPLCSGSAEFYSRLAGQNAYYSPTRWEFTQAAALVEKERAVVDVGCGDGHFLSLVSCQTKLGLEFNPEAVKRGRERGLDVRQGDLTTLPPASADVITLFQVLEHVIDPLGLLQQAVRALRVGGRVMIAVPNNDGFLGESIQDPLNAPPHHALRWGINSLQYLPRLLPVRLERVETEPLCVEHLFHYRRAQVTRRVGAILRRQVPRMRLTPATVLLRKAANAYAMFSMKVCPTLPREPVAGHSLFAVYRKI